MLRAAVEATMHRVASEGVRRVQSSRPEQVLHAEAIVFPVPTLSLLVFRESLDPSWDLGPASNPRSAELRLLNKNLATSR